MTARKKRRHEVQQTVYASRYYCSCSGYPSEVLTSPRAETFKMRSLEWQVSRAIKFPGFLDARNPPLSTPLTIFKSRRLQVPSANMLAHIQGARISSILPRLHPRLLPLRPYSTSDRTSDRVPTNDPSPPKPVQNVSDSNAVPISPQGLRDSDRPLQEMPEDSERQRVMQAPNRKDVWSRSQQPRERAMSGPRFEQTIMEYQVCCIGPGHSTWVDEGTVEGLADLDAACLAPTRSSHQPHPQAARKMDKDTDCVL